MQVLQPRAPTGTGLAEQCLPLALPNATLDMALPSQPVVHAVCFGHTPLRAPLRCVVVGILEPPLLPVRKYIRFACACSHHGMHISRNGTLVTGVKLTIASPEAPGRAVVAGLSCGVSSLQHTVSLA